MKLIPMTEVEEAFGLSESTIRRQEKCGLLPPRVLNGDKVRSFVKEEIEIVMAARINNLPLNQQKLLVKSLIAKRKEMKYEV